MKKTTLATIVLAAVMLAPTAVCAAAPATPAPAPAAVAPVATAATAATKMVKVNGVEMTQAQARLVILQNIKNHRQMTPEEMTAYVNNLAANEGNK